jgi:DNA-binding NarL/FixJ family response regulator
LTTHTQPHATDPSGPATPIRVALADDSFLIREAVQQVLAGLDDIEVVAVCADGDELWLAIERTRPDVVVTDVRMPPGGDDEGIRIAARLREAHPQIGVIVLSQFTEPRYGMALLEHGAEGRVYLLKERLHDRSELRSAIEVAARGGTMIDPAMIQSLLDTRHDERQSPLSDLTPREREVLAEMAQGRSNAAIGESLVLTKRAVEKHIGSIFHKLGLEDEETVSRRVAAVLLYLSSNPPK